jgi:hypothetical protein
MMIPQCIVILLTKASLNASSVTRAFRLSMTSLHVGSLSKWYGSWIVDSNGKTNSCCCQEPLPDLKALL